MINEFSKNPTLNHKAHREAMSDLSVTAIIRAVDYITVLSQFINSNNEVLDELYNMLEPLNSIIEKLRTEKTCVHCGAFLYKSDLPQYDYVCPDCDENF